MTAADLIRALRKLDPNAEVFFRDDTEQPEIEHEEQGAWLGTVERVECDSDGFIILSGETCEDEDEDDSEGHCDDEEDDDEEVEP